MMEEFRCFHTKDLWEVKISSDHTSMFMIIIMIVLSVLKTIFLNIPQQTETATENLKAMDLYAKTALQEIPAPITQNVKKQWLNISGMIILKWQKIFVIPQNTRNCMKNEKKQ